MCRREGRVGLLELETGVHEGRFELSFVRFCPELFKVALLQAGVMPARFFVSGRTSGRSEVETDGLR